MKYGMKAESIRVSERQIRNECDGFNREVYAHEIDPRSLIDKPSFSSFSSFSQSKEQINPWNLFMDETQVRSPKDKIN